MRVMAFDPFVGAERYRELGVERAESSDDVYAWPTSSLCTCPRRRRPRAGCDAAALAKCRTGSAC